MVNLFHGDLGLVDDSDHLSFRIVTKDGTQPVTEALIGGREVGDHLVLSDSRSVEVTGIRGFLQV